MMNCPSCGAIMVWLNGTVLHDPPVKHYECKTCQLFVIGYADGNYEARSIQPEELEEQQKQKQQQEEQQKQKQQQEEQQLEQPPFTAKSIVEYCWGMTLNLSHVVQQNKLGETFNAQFFKILESSQPPLNTKFSNDLLMRLAQSLRTMAFTRDAHVRYLNDNARRLSEKKKFWNDITQLASLSKEGLPMQVLSFLGAGSAADLINLGFFGGAANSTSSSFLTIFILFGAIGVVAVTVVLKIIGTIYVGIQEKRIKRKQDDYYKNRFKRDMTNSLFNFYDDVKELITTYYPNYLKTPMGASDILADPPHNPTEVKRIIYDEILPPDDLDWSLWYEPTSDKNSSD